MMMDGDDELMIAMMMIVNILDNDDIDY